MEIDSKDGIDGAILDILVVLGRENSSIDLDRDADLDGHTNSDRDMVRDTTIIDMHVDMDRVDMDQQHMNIWI